MKEHIERLHKGMAILKMDIDPNISEQYFDNAIKELAAKNEIGADGRVRLTVYRNEGGLYTPETTVFRF